MQYHTVKKFLTVSNGNQNTKRINIICIIRNLEYFVFQHPYPWLKKTFKTEKIEYLTVIDLTTLVVDFNYSQLVTTRIVNYFNTFATL